MCLPHNQVGPKHVVRTTSCSVVSTSDIFNTPANSGQVMLSNSIVSCLVNIACVAIKNIQDCSMSWSALERATACLSSMSASASARLLVLVEDVARNLAPNRLGLVVHATVSAVLGTTSLVIDFLSIVGGKSNFDVVIDRGISGLRLVLGDAGLIHLVHPNERIVVLDAQLLETTKKSAFVAVGGAEARVAAVGLTIAARHVDFVERGSGARDRAVVAMATVHVVSRHGLTHLGDQKRSRWVLSVGGCVRRV